MNCCIPPGLYYPISFNCPASTATPATPEYVLTGDDFGLFQISDNSALINIESTENRQGDDSKSRRRLEHAMPEALSPGNGWARDRLRFWNEIRFEDFPGVINEFGA